jgi:outer membrane protein assembly factor BamB
MKPTTTPQSFHRCRWIVASALPLGVALFRSILLPPASAAVTEAWTHRYSNLVSNSSAGVTAVVRDVADNVVITGNPSDSADPAVAVTIKYSGADGSLLWLQRYRLGTARALAVDGNGNVLVAGSVIVGQDSQGNPRQECFTAKYAAANGELLWDRRHHGGGDSNDSAVAVAVDTSGSAVVTGSSGTIKYLASGTPVWTNSAAGSVLAVDGSGNVVVTGPSGTVKYLANGATVWTSDAGGTALALDGSDHVFVMTGSGTIKYQANGTAIWTNHASGVALAVDGDGNAIMTGYFYNGTNTDYATAKYAATDGALLWEQRYNGPADLYDWPNAVAVDSYGDVLVTGISQDTNTFFDCYTVKYAAATGAMLWEQRYKGPGNLSDFAAAVIVDGSGNVVMAGSASVGIGTDYYTVEYAADNGNVLWEQFYEGSANSNDKAEAVAVDGLGNVVVTGSSVGLGSSGRLTEYLYTAKYAAANGALLWERRGPELDTSTPLGSFPVAGVAVDGHGNVVVAAPAAGEFDAVWGSKPDYYTAKYAAADGALLWEQRYNGPANGWDDPLAVAVDASGNAVVTGTSTGNGSGFDYYTAKYAAATGALLWERRYNGPGNNSDLAHAAAVDPEGNVVVTGSSTGLDGNGNCYTAKYAASDGALLWERRYSGPSNGSDAVAVAIDGNGNVVVTGTSRGNGTGLDYYTARYAAADGTLLWEKRYNGPANLDDRAVSVAVDASGNVVVTGYSPGDFDPFSGTFPNQYYTAKYAAADGALLWEQRNPKGMDAIAQAVVVDSRGNAIVTGTVSFFSFGRVTSDYYTSKYAAADGAVLWEKRYDGPANGKDAISTSHCLALAPNGRIAVTGHSDSSFSPWPQDDIYDFATVVYREEMPPSLSIEFVPPAIRVSLAGVPSQPYILERAPSVWGPWGSLATNTAPASGLLDFQDTAPPPGQAFYRAVTP